MTGEEVECRWLSELIGATAWDLLFEPAFWSIITIKSTLKSLLAVISWQIIRAMQYIFTENKMKNLFIMSKLIEGKVAYNKHLRDLQKLCVTATFAAPAVHTVDFW